MGTPTRNNIGFKGRKDHASTLKSDIIIIGNIKEKKDDNPSDSNDNKDYKKIKISKSNKYYGE